MLEPIVKPSVFVNHAMQTAHGLASKTSTEIVSMNDPAPEYCGFGKVSEVPVESVHITYEQSLELIRYLPALGN
jgi:hypothetical protein